MSQEEKEKVDAVRDKKFDGIDESYVRNAKFQRRMTKSHGCGGC